MADDRVNSFLSLADEELSAAKTLLASSLPRQAAYQLSQAAEKAARAVCEFEEIAVGTTHSLSQISALLPPGHPLKQQIRELDYLSSSSTKYRYPAASGHISKPPEATKLKEDIEDVERFVEAAKDYIKKPVVSKTKPKHTEEERKTALIEKIVSILRMRDVPLPNSAVETLSTYADEQSLHRMTKAAATVDTFKGLFDSQSITIPGDKAE